MVHHTYACIEHQHSHVRLHCLTDLHHLLEQLTLLLMPTTRIDNDNFESFLLEFCDTLSSNGDGVRLRV